MTDTATETPAETGAEIVVTEQIAGLVKGAMLEVERGKATFGEALVAVLGDRLPEAEVTPKPVAPIKITDEHRAALTRIVEQYGLVAPETPRRLTLDEQVAIVEERETIDVILGLLAKRKDTSIREALANHLDRLAEEEAGGPEAARARHGVNKDGHYTVKQDVPVDGTTHKIQGIVGEPKPSISNEALLSAYEKGDLTRAEYLSITRESLRVFDESKAREAIKKQPGLLFKIAKTTAKPAKTLTIKVGNA
jgi:hypothetical protein